MIRAGELSYISSYQIMSADKLGKVIKRARSWFKKYALCAHRGKAVAGWNDRSTLWSMTVDVCNKQVIGHLETQNTCLKAQYQTIQNRGCTEEFSCVKAKKVLVPRKQEKRNLYFILVEKHIAP